MEENDRYTEYATNLISGICKFPEQLSVKKTTDEQGVLLLIRCSKADMGGLIGKAGETAKAIRHLVRIAGVINQARVSLKIEEPEG